MWVEYTYACQSSVISGGISVLCLAGYWVRTTCAWFGLLFFCAPLLFPDDIPTCFLLLKPRILETAKTNLELVTLGMCTSCALSERKLDHTFFEFL